MRTNIITTYVHDGARTFPHSTHLGEDLPRYLQIAFGRGVFRLLHAQRPHTPGLIYLRDLPLNLATLAAHGYPHALGAYHAECQRAGIGPISELCV
jgi:hypothetical protein